MFDNQGNVCNFTGEHRFLSNFWPCAIRLDGAEYPSVEHAYQASKTHDVEQRMAIRAEPKPGIAKRIGQRLTRRPDWKDTRVPVMTHLLCQKFSDPVMRGLLDGTGGVLLIEGNYWHDNFWGECTCARCANKEKRNELGMLLMFIRDHT